MTMQRPLKCLRYKRFNISIINTHRGAIDMDNKIKLDEYEIELIKQSLIIMPIFYKRMAENCLNEGCMDTATKNTLKDLRKINDLSNNLINLEDRDDKITLILSRITIVKKIIAEINFINNNEKTKKYYNKIYEKIKDIN